MTSFPRSVGLPGRSKQLAVQRGSLPLCCVCRRAVKMSLSSIVVILLCTLQYCAVVVSTPAFSDFPADARHVFSLSSTDYYHSLFVDSRNDSVLFLGAVDRVYMLNAQDISTDYRQSPNLTANSGFLSEFEKNKNRCMQYQALQNKSVRCRNHVRTIHRVVNSSEIYVCATGAYFPQEFYLNDSLHVIATPTGGERGRAKCPYDPTSVYVCTYVTKGNAYHVPSLYTAVATDSNSDDVHIIRPPLYYNRTSTSKLGNILRTEPDAKWINTAEAVYVVGVFNIDDYVYFVFRELALESSVYCGKTYYSRVARVCKKDRGGTGLGLEHRFTSFLKARLVCSVTTPPSTVPYFFNDVYDVQYNTSSREFYALFLANSDGQWGSAVCAFNLTDINRVFDEGDFLERPSLESAWSRVPTASVPNPRPGQCVDNSKDYSTSAFLFIKSHTLMADPVNPSGGQPLYYSKELAFTKMKVDMVNGYTILYLYCAGQKEIHQVALWSNDNRPQFQPVSVWKPFAKVPAVNASRSLILWTMLLHTVGQIKWLYLTVDVAVVQLNTELCQLYTKCIDCIRDPHCGWNIDRCQQYEPGLIQDVQSNDTAAVCSSSCLKEYKWTSVIPGMALHLNCSSSCLPDGATVDWSTPTKARPVNSSAGYVMSVDNGLVILSVNATEHAGTFQCSYNGRSLTRHIISLSECRYGDWNVWLSEYENYCRKFDEYLVNYNKWQCLMNNCTLSRCSAAAQNNCS